MHSAIAGFLCLLNFLLRKGGNHGVKDTNRQGPPREKGREDRWVRKERRELRENLLCLLTLLVIYVAGMFNFLRLLFCQCGPMMRGIKMIVMISK